MLRAPGIRDRDSCEAESKGLSEGRCYEPSQVEENGRYLKGRATHLKESCPKQTRAGVW